MSSIEWTDVTWNPVVGCRRVSPGCEHCYAETMAGRLARIGQQRYLDVVKVDAEGKPRGRWNGTFREVPEVLAAPLKWRKPRRVFVNSMSDLFGDGVSDEWIAAVFGVMAATPQHTYQILTKRPERAVQWYKWIAEQGAYLRAVVGETPTAPGGEVASACASAAKEKEYGGVLTPDGWRNAMRAPWPLPNVWIGASVEDQQRADERIPHLLNVPAAVRFLSCEPLLGPVDLRAVPMPDGDALGNALFNHGTNTGIDWVIVGGESGPGARPCDVAWIRSIVAQCKAAASVLVFVKQIGARPVVQHPMEPGALVDARCADRKGGDPSEWPDDLLVREWPR